jgi:hypothetical protein
LRHFSLVDKLLAP